MEAGAVVVLDDSLEAGGASCEVDVGTGVAVVDDEFGGGTKVLEAGAEVELELLVALEDSGDVVELVVLDDGAG